MRKRCKARGVAPGIASAKFSALRRSVCCTTKPRRYCLAPPSRLGAAEQGSESAVERGKLPAHVGNEGGSTLQGYLGRSATTTPSSLPENPSL